jgi:hypothetical protein
MQYWREWIVPVIIAVVFILAIIVIGEMKGGA